MAENITQLFELLLGSFNNPSNGTDNNVTNNSVVLPQNACYNEYIESFFVLVITGPACLIGLLLCFLQSRKIIGLNCCWGRPSVVYPINFIDENERRWAFAAVFGVTAYRIIRIFEGHYFFRPAELDDPEWMAKFKWVDVFVKVFNALLVCANFYPMAACLTMRRNIVANIMGFIYTAAWVAVTLLILFSCDPVTEEDQINDLLQLIYDVPVAICYLVLLGAYVYDFVLNIMYLTGKKVKVQRTYIEKDVDIDVKLKYPQPVQYVKALLNRPVTEVPGNFLGKVRFKAKYVVIKGLRYSPRIICTMVLAIFGLYKFAMNLGLQLDFLLQFLLSWLELVEGPAYLAELGKTYEFVREILVVLRVSLIAANIISLAFIVLSMVHMVIMYRRNFRKLLYGRRTWHHKYAECTSPDSMLLGSVRYCGYQAAFLFYGWGLLFGLLFAAMVAVAYLLVIPLRDGFPSLIVELLKNFWPTLLVSLLLQTLQMLLCKFVFLQGRTEMALDNRRWFHVFAFFMAFFNVLVGLFSALKRIVFSVVFGILLLGRLDRVLLMRGAEKFDSGFSAYLGMLYTDLYHNHPVLKAFAYLLLESQKTKSQKDENKESTEKGQEILSIDNKKRRIRNRWFKAYTLVKNPVLVLERFRQYIEEEENKKTMGTVVHTLGPNPSTTLFSPTAILANQSNGDAAETHPNADEGIDSTSL